MVIERLPDMASERRGLFVGQIEDHDRLNIAAAPSRYEHPHGKARDMSSFRAYRERPVGGITEGSRDRLPPIMGSGHWPGGTAPRLPRPLFEKIVRR